MPELNCAMTIQTRLLLRIFGVSTQISPERISKGTLMGPSQGTNRDTPQRKSRKPTNESRESSKTYRENNPENNSNGSARNESNGSSSLTADKLARGLGWFSLGLGAAQILAPRTVAKIAGVNPDENQSLIRLFGLRELASGVAIFMQGDRPAEAVWSRVAGDALDLASLGMAFTSPNSHKPKLGFATANVLAITALDVLCAQELSRKNGGATSGEKARKSLVINRSPEELYQEWRNFEQLPRFMRQLVSVKETGDGRSHWIAKGPGGTLVEWDAQFLDDRLNEFIAWQSLENADVQNSGSVEFRSAPGNRGTIVTVELNYNLPGGVVGNKLAKLFHEDPGALALESLRCFKQIMEVGEVSVSDGTIWDNGFLTQRPAQPAKSEELAHAPATALKTRKAAAGRAGQED
jgi:uncharacterized membrane protein